jgi:acyl-homoserine-lactone acylase
MDYPANGGPGEYGIFRTIYFADDNDNKKRAIAGETYVAVIEFGKKVKAQLLLSYGNATQPGSKHLGDQLIMLSEKKLRPALLEKADILKNLEKRESLKIDYKN